MTGIGLSVGRIYHNIRAILVSFSGMVELYQSVEMVLRSKDLRGKETSIVA